MDYREQELIQEMSRALDNLDDRKYDRLHAELQRHRATKKWKGIK